MKKVLLKVSVNVPDPGGMLVRIAYLQDNKEISLGTIDLRGIFITQFEFIKPVDVQVRVRHLGYLPFECNAKITKNGLNINAIMIKDRIYSGPLSPTNPAYWIKDLLKEIEDESIWKSSSC
jgi:hypothetical protein